jgi:hypothetical protein
MNRLSLTVSALVILTAAFAAHSFAKPQNKTPSQDLSSHDAQFTAISVVRTINTAEAGYRFNPDKGATQPRNHYATWSELFSSGVFDEMKPPPTQTSNAWWLLSADGIHGYKLALIVSPDGQSYQLALHDANPQSVGFSAFSDQTGIIYTGSPLQ